MKVDNSAIIAYLLTVYKATQKADVFILGFNIDNAVYFAGIPLDVVLTDFSGISMTSDEIPVKRLRIKPLNKKTQILFNMYSPIFLCSFDELQNLAKSDFGGNCGQCFEKLICDFYDGIPAQQNTAFWKSGDFEKDGLQYQVKFQLATIVTEITAKQAEKECLISV